jgi:hypothetical protein
MNTTKFLIICLTAVPWAQFAEADIIPFTLAQVIGCVGPNTRSCSQVVGGSNVLRSSINTTLPAGTGTAAMSASAQSGYGILHSSAAESFSGSSTPVFSYVNAAASFYDGITISFDPFNGSLGYLLIDFTLDGTNSLNGSLKALSYANVRVDAVSSQEDALSFTSSSVSGTFEFQRTFAFIYGQPFGLYFNLGTIVGTVDPGSAFAALGAGTGLISLRTATGAGSAAADFSNTLVLSALDVVDSNGQPVNGVTITSKSGTQYSVNGVVPEPSFVPILLLIGGLLGFTAHRQGRAANSAVNANS